MAVEIIMPKVDMVMDEGTFVEWLKGEGEAVLKGEPLFVVLTDKAAIEVEAPESGILGGLIAKPDDVVPVAGVIGYILQPGEEVAEIREEQVSPRAATPSAEIVKDEGRLKLVEANPDFTGQEPLRATPLARNYARELQVDLAEVVGSGPRGRIYREDVRRHLETRPTGRGEQGGAGLPLAERPLPPVKVTSPAVKLPEAKIKERIALKGPRAIIAARLSHSASSIPHVYIDIAVDMSEAVRLKQQVQAHYTQAYGKGLSYTALIAYAVAHLLPNHPLLNSSLVDDEIILWDDVHLGIAMDLEDYLIVPVVRNAQSLSLADTFQAIQELLERARLRKLIPAEMSGSTFSISNLGMLGATRFTALINPPETAILAVGKIADLAVPLHQEVVVRPVMTLTLGIDHRVIDGAAGTRFLTDLKSLLENPYLLI